MDKESSCSKAILGGPSLEELKEACLKNTPVIFEVDVVGTELEVTVQSLTDLQRPGVDRWKVCTEVVEDKRKVSFYYSFPKKIGLYVFE